MRLIAYLKSVSKKNHRMNHFKFFGILLVLLINQSCANHKEESHILRSEEPVYSQKPSEINTPIVYSKNDFQVYQNKDSILIKYLDTIHYMKSVADLETFIVDLDLNNSKVDKFYKVVSNVQSEKIKEILNVFKKNRLDISSFITLKDDQKENRFH